MSTTSRTAGLIGIVAIVLTMPAITARADDPEDWLAGEHATGDWGGLRDALKEAGITVEGSYVVDLQALTHGGASHGGNWDYAGLMDLGIDFDLEKLMGLDGLSFFIQAGWASGDDLARKVGSIFSPGEAFSGRSLRLARMYLQQDLLNEQLQLKIGRLATEDDFLSSPIYLEYVSGAINSVPGSILESTPGFTTFPFAQWGVVAAGKPTEHLRLAAGIYASDADINKDKEHGVDFSLDTNKGVMTIGEIGYSWGPDLSKSKKAESKNMTELGLPGNVKLGGWYDTGPRTSLKDDTQSKGNNGGLYVSAQQMVYRGGGADSLEGLTPWVVLTYAPKQSINLVPVFVGAGMVYQGLIPNRDEDRAALGFFYGALSRDAEHASSEKVFEIAYTAQLTPWFYIRPDAQFILDPGGNNSTSTAVVLGGEMGITF